jgi:C4-dicarboxylate-specific signal transduction histidine kinase
VQLALWPLPQVIEGPLYLLVVALLLLGTLVGFGLGWWASRHARRRAREAAREAERLDREVTRLKEALAEARPMPAYAGPAPREQKAIERQTALVAPESMPLTARGRTP